MPGLKVEDNLSFNYDKQHDVLYVSIGKPVPSYSDDDEVKGVLIRRAINTGEVTGVTIIDYSRRNKEQLQKVLPFKVKLI